LTPSSINYFCNFKCNFLEFLTEKYRQKTLAYYEICHFPVNHESVMFLAEAPGANDIKIFTSSIYKFS
jgi:hypothetical protein